MPVIRQKLHLPLRPNFRGQLCARSNGPKIAFTTYQSSDKLAAAARKARINFDLAILDEAHKTVGIYSKTFATLLSDKKIKIHRRLFMTATERVFRGGNDEVRSMDSEKDYGARFHQLSFKEAIKQRIVSDYKILTMTVSDNRIRELVDKNRILNLDPRDLDEAEAQSIAAGIVSSGFMRNTRLHTQFHFIGVSVRQIVSENSKTPSIGCTIQAQELQICTFQVGRLRDSVAIYCASLLLVSALS